MQSARRARDSWEGGFIVGKRLASGRIRLSSNRVVNRRGLGLPVLRRLSAYPRISGLCLLFPAYYNSGTTTQTREGNNLLAERVLTYLAS